MQGPGLLSRRETGGLTFGGAVATARLQGDTGPRPRVGGSFWHLRLWSHFRGWERWNLPSSGHPSWSELALTGAQR